MAEETKKQLEIYLVKQVEAAGIDIFLKEYKIVKRIDKQETE